MLRHRQLLDQAVQAAAGMVPRLHGLSVYVSGASGFLASSLLAFLAELDREYRLGIRLFASARRRQDEVRLFDFLGVRPTIDWQVAPVQTATLPNLPGLVVVHAASFGSPRDFQREPLGTFEANTLGLKSLYEQAESVRAGQVVYVSSAEIYGQPPDIAIPTPEGYTGGLETLSPRSIYGESKRMAEVLGACFAEHTGIPFSALRPWNLYGPGQRPDDGRVPVEFIRQARIDHGIKLASNGSPRRCFCHVWDGLRQVVAVFRHTETASAFNIGNSGSEISMLDLARACAAACGLGNGAVTYDPNSRAPGLQRCVPDISAVSDHPGTPAEFTSLTDGIHTLVEWFDFLAVP